MEYESPYVNDRYYYGDSGDSSGADVGKWIIDNPLKSYGIGVMVVMFIALMVVYLAMDLTAEERAQKLLAVGMLCLVFGFLTFVVGPNMAKEGASNFSISIGKNDFRMRRE